MTEDERIGINEAAPSGCSHPLVYVLLVSWNSCAHTLECLSTLRESTYPNVKVVVVDNGSRDGSVEAIVAVHPDVVLLALGENRGFTGANNEGFRYAVAQGAEFIYLLNTDAFGHPEFLTQAVCTALSDPTIGIVGSKVLHAGARDILQFAGARVNLRTGYSGRPAGYNQRDHGQCDHIADVDWVTGCAMMASRACIDAIGGFDDRYFAFHEDVDLCLRARRAGFRVVMSPSSRVWHEGGGSLDGAASATHLYYSVRNALRLVHTHGPAYGPVASFLRVGCIVAAHTVQMLLSRPTIIKAKSILAGLRDYYRGVEGMRPTKTVTIAGEAA